jgi:putative ubiquitin-RnfH superfamily antitoxin RatB of RatAB toxin-antitoxin module
MMHETRTLSVEVVFALPDRQEIVPVLLEDGATVSDAIEESAIAELFPGWDLHKCRVGIWGRVAERDQRLRAGDRVEIYRPLRIDPREARRSLAAKGKWMGGSGGVPKAGHGGGQTP